MNTLTDSMPISRDGTMMINWTGKWEQSFPHYSYIDVLKSFEAVENGRKPLISPKAFEDKIVVIGYTALGLTDIKATPIQAVHPGVGILTNILNSILTERYTARASKLMNASILIIMGIICLSLITATRNPISFPIGALFCIGWTGIAYLIFVHTGIFLNVMQPILCLIALDLYYMATAKIWSDREKYLFFLKATRDGLTGLFTMTHFRGLLDQAIVRSKKVKRPLSVIMVDIDHFKKINDTYGHQAGDMILKGTAQRIQSMIKTLRPKAETDAVARYGGEEFIIFLQNADNRITTYLIAERIRSAIGNTPFIWDNAPIPVTISLGVAVIREGDTRESLIERADQALYTAKHQGRNRTCLDGVAKARTAPPQLVAA